MLQGVVESHFGHQLPRYNEAMFVGLHCTLMKADPKYPQNIIRLSKIFVMFFYNKSIQKF